MTRGLAGLLVVVAGFLPACGSFGPGADKQWYKPGVDYTVAEFQRDRQACEKNKELDEACLRERGWVPLSADKAAAPPPLDTGSRGTQIPGTAPSTPTGATSGGGRYR